MSALAAVASPKVTAGPYMAAKLRALDIRLGELEQRVLRQTDDEACHDLRVVLRRIRTVLEVGRKVLGPFFADEVRSAFRDLQHASGDLRDEEVLLSTIGSLGVDRPDTALWVASRKRRERARRRALQRLLEAGALRRGRRLLEALLAFRVNPARDRRLAKFARRAVLRARREVDRSRSAPVDDAEALHRLRISFKRLRYSVETFAEVLPSDLAALGVVAAKFQRRLGDLHDVDVALRVVRRARLLSAESRSELLARLERVRATHAAAYARDCGAAHTTPTPPQAVGTVSARNTSTR